MDKKKAMPIGRQGFTLIEILIVIAIIGILAGAILVSLNSSQKKSNGAAFKKTLSSLKAGIALCCAEPTNRLRTTAGMIMCKNSGGVDVGTSKLPTASELSTDPTYPLFAYSIPSISGINMNCASNEPTIQVAVRNIKNKQCGFNVGNGNGAYRISPTRIQHYWNTPPPATWRIGFPAGC